MMHEYVQSSEQYKGFTLVMTMCRLHDYDAYHRRCRVLNSNGEGVSVCKTKKEAKDLIKNGYIK